MKNYKAVLSALLLFLGGVTFLSAQESDLPFRELSDYPDAYSETVVVGRMIESLGFRYYWASEGFSESDLAFKASDETRSIGATLEHIYDLSQIIRNSAEKKMNSRSERAQLDYKELRSATLMNLQIAMEIISSSEQLDDFEILFSSGSYPFWNQINGPISDAIWHCGQLATLRRLSGNPMNPEVNHFTGRLKD